MLKISTDLELPVDAVTGTYGILATKGAGKSNAAVVMAEEMWDAGVPWVAVDPKGDWWGIRSSENGIRLTDHGQATADELGIEPIGDLWAHWYNHPKVDGTGRKILDVLANHWPNSIDRLTLADACGYHERSKGFTNALGRLRSLELVTRGPDIRLTDDLGEAQ